ncbi:ubiquinone biosynthesis O-methyltransferase, mitochondrial isoform X1 [Ziziphus jujuba]|uniref:Ubiquinone biosynthesis O-methyltransferase, mitochondrial n=1 Tax=Ziziphus jujuba TaxID=326968 RepID=A0ABM3IFT1_ZIZJJ|nr:ubiquinone biosynthesis O-methyltransferase, mitochondrial isoform X1 [Ziziphus jujuba]XP_048327482.1 ubiquinone biosynthesis O-methyltransferase, mitochondrial isoform X1 [Ziziphus jujuba]XP_048327483.1 ubiquinone biosynthesis O-methyltransferase, mitochondrial isoform X1 [Ziziphus jujuba]
MAFKLPNQLRALYTATNYHHHHRILSPLAGASQSFVFSLRRLFADVPPLSDPSSAPPPLYPHSTKTSLAPSSLNQYELAKFAAIAETWWDSEGPFKPLHALNPTRLAFIRSTLCRHFRRDSYSAKPFEGLKFVDVGCGGGILSEPLARMGATVTGVDAVEKNIKIARLHAVWPFTNLSPIWIPQLQRLNIVAQQLLVEEQRTFDAVIALEVIEHVAEPAEFCKSLATLTVPGGATVISTINRSIRAYATAIIAAEYLLHWLPKGTHQWSSFLTPEELVLILQRASISVQEMAGFAYNPLTGRWSLSDDISVNFIAFGTKNSQ